MRHLILVLAVLGAPLSAMAEGDPRFGRWTCALPKQPFGTIILRETSYSFEGTDYAPSGRGEVTWTSDAFGLSGGPLARFGIVSGLVFVSPDPAAPGVMVDLYNGIGVAVHCVPD